MADEQGSSGRNLAGSRKPSPVWLKRFAAGAIMFMIVVLFGTWSLGFLNPWLHSQPAEITFPPPPPMSWFLPVCYDGLRANPEQTLWPEQYEPPNADFWKRVLVVIQKSGRVHAVRDDGVYIHDSYNEPRASLNTRGVYRRIQKRWRLTRSLIYQRALEEMRSDLGRTPSPEEIARYYDVLPNDRGNGDCKLFRRFFLSLNSKDAPN